MGTGNYKDGTPANFGDVVAVGGEATGIVVAVIDAGRYAAGYSADEWGYLKSGVLVESSDGGLIHYPDAERYLYLSRNA